MNSAPRNDPDQADREVSGRAPEPDQGQKVGPYRILSPLGVGGMGEVYLAQDQTLERQVALKFLSRVMEEDATARERFLREARLAAALDHPFICKVYEIGEEDGKPYISMEYLKGQTLQQRMEAGPPDLQEALLIAVEVGEALAEAHSRGIVHRDLKPGNIMIGPRGHAKVLDFGLAKRVSSTQELVTQMEVLDGLTRPGATVGTLAYMSPEQLRGETLDTRSDIFSFGVLLQELMTGVHPFLQAQAMETASSILRDEPAPISSAPEGLEKILRKMLAKRPEDRYQTVEEVVEALHQIRRRGEPEAWYLRPAPLMLVAVLVLATLVLIWQTRPSPPLRLLSSVAILPLTNVGDESGYLASAISESVTGRLQRIGRQVTPWETVERYEGIKRSPISVAEEMKVEGVLAGNFEDSGEDLMRVEVFLTEVGTGVTAWSETFEIHWEELFDLHRQIALEVARRMKGDLTEEEMQILAKPESENADAYDFVKNGAYNLRLGTENSTENAMRHFNRALELDPNLAEAYVGLGSVHYNRFFHSWKGSPSELDAAEENFDKALDLDLKNVQARRGKALIYFERGDDEKTLEQGREAMRGRSENDVEALLTLGWSYIFGGLGQELGVKTMEKVLDLDPMNQPAQWVLAVVADPEMAKAYLKRFGEDQQVYFYLGLDYLLQGQLVQALENFEKVSAGVESARTLASWDLLGLLYSGIIHQRLDDAEKAGRDWKLAVNLLEQDLEEEADSIKKRILLACFYGLLDSEAFEAQKNLVLERTSGHLNLIDLLYLAGVLLKRGDTREGQEVLSNTVERGRLLNYRSLGVIEGIIGSKFELPPELKALNDRIKAAFLQEYGRE